MFRQSRLWFLGLLVLLVMSGCGGSGSSAKQPASVGAVAFRMDLSSLAAAPAATDAAKAVSKAAITTITGVTVTLTREGSTTVTADLTVANNIATGTIQDLASGYWHVTADVYSSGTKIYTGSTDTQVIPGAEAQASILFDPVIVTPTTGSLRVTVGLNPMPGYSLINQLVTKVMYNDVDGKTYIFDAAAGIIGVYNAETMVRERNITLPQVPLAITLSSAKDSFYLGYSSGKIYRLNIQSGEYVLVGDVLGEVSLLQPVNDKFLVVTTKAAYYSDTNVKVLDVTTSQVVATQSYWYAFSDTVFNPANGMIYAQDWNVSPQDLHRIQIDPATGAITALAGSRYHGNYYLGSPLRIINHGTRLSAASGKTFSSSTASSSDITYAGSLGYGYADAVSDDTLNLIYLLSVTEVKKLLIMRQDNFFVDKTVDLLGTPKYIYQTNDSIAVFSQKDNESLYVKVFKKADLGLK